MDYFEKPDLGEVPTAGPLVAAAFGFGVAEELQEPLVGRGEFRAREIQGLRRDIASFQGDLAVRTSTEYEVVDGEDEKGKHVRTYRFERSADELPQTLFYISKLLHGGEDAGRLAVSAIVGEKQELQLTMVPADSLHAADTPDRAGIRLTYRRPDASGDKNVEVRARGGIGQVGSGDHYGPARANVESLIGVGSPFTESELALEAITGLRDVLRSTSSWRTVDWHGALQAAPEARATTDRIFEEQFKQGRFTMELNTANPQLPPMLTVLARDLGIKTGRHGQNLFVTFGMDGGWQQMHISPMQRTPYSSGAVLKRPASAGRGRTPSGMSVRLVDDSSIASQYVAPDMYKRIDHSDLLLEDMYNQLVFIAADTKSRLTQKN